MKAATLVQQPYNQVLLSLFPDEARGPIPKSQPSLLLPRSSRATAAELQIKQQPRLRTPLIEGLTVVACIDSTNVRNAKKFFGRADGSADASTDEGGKRPPKVTPKRSAKAAPKRTCKGKTSRN